jgi:hypothetical protein
VDQYYIEEGYYTPEKGYFVYIAVAQAQPSSSFIISAIASELADANISISAVATFSAQVDRFRDVDSAITSAATQTTLVGKIQEAQADFGALFTPSIEAEAVVNQTATLDSVSTMSVDIAVNRSATIALANIGNLNSQADKFVGYDSLLSSVFSQTADVNYTAENQSTFTATASQTATVNTQAEGQSTLSSSFTQTTDVLSLTLAQSSMTARANVFASKYLGTGRPRNLTDIGASYVTSPVKFGTYSFEGSLQLPYADNQAKNTIPDIADDFVLETWFYRDGTTATSLFRWEGLSPSVNPAFILLRYNATGTITLQLGSDTINVINSTAVTNAAWHHILVSKNSTNISLFVNGTRSGTLTPPSAPTQWAGRSSTSQRLTITAGTHFLDESSLHIGTTLGYDPTGSSITVPTTVRTNNETTTAFLYHYENNGLDDVALAQTGQATLSSSFTQTTSGRRTASALSNQSVVASLAADGSIAIEGSAGLSTTASLTASVGLLQEQSSSISSEFAQTTTATKLNGFDVSASSTASVSADNVRVRYFDISVDSLFTPALSVDVFKNQTALLESAFVIDIQVTSFSDSEANLSSEFAITANNEKIKQFASALSSQFSQSATVGFQRDFSSSLNATATQAITETRLRFAGSTMSAAATQTATAFRIKQFSGAFSGAMSFFIDGIYFEGGRANFTTTAALTASYKVSESSWNQRTWWRGAYNANNTLYGPKAIGAQADDYSYEVYGWESNADNTHGFVIIERAVKTGNIIYQKWFTFGHDVEGELSGCVYKDGFIYVSYSAFISAWRTSVLKIRADDGLVIWQTNTPGVEKIEDIAVDDSGNVYISGWANTSPTRYGYGKLNSSGVRQWTRSYGFAPGTGINLRATKISVAEGFLWVNIDRDPDTGANDSYLIKARLDTGDHIDGIDINLGRVKSHGGYLYAIEDDTLDGGNTIYKFDTNLNITAKKQIGTWSIADFDIDSSGNLYFLSEDFNLARVNADWSVAWVSRFASEATSGSAGSLRPQGSLIHWDGDQKVYVSGMNNDVYLSNNSLQLSLFGRVNRDFGINYYTSPIPYRDSIEVFNGATSGDTSSAGTWTYSPDSLTVTDLTPGTFTVYFLQAQGTSAQSNGGAVEILGYTTSAFTNYEYVRPVAGQGAITSTATLTALVSRTRQGQGQFTSVSTVVAQGTILRFAEAALTSNFAQATTALKTARITQTLTAQATQAITYQRIRFAQSAISASASVTADTTKFTGYGSAMTCTLTQVTNNDRFRGVTANLQVTGSKVITAAVNATGTILLESQATIAVTAVKTAELPSFLTANATLNIDAIKSVRTEAQITSTFALTAQDQRIRFGQAQLTTQATLSLDISKITGLSSALTSTCTQTAQGSRVRRITTTLASSANLSAQAQRIKQASAGLTSQFTGIFVFGKIVRITANLSAQGFQLTAGDVINLDPALTYVVPPETRSLMIRPEDREYLVSGETRVYKLI